MANEFIASVDKEGRLFIKPIVERTRNAQGGTDVNIRLPSIGQIRDFKKTIDKDGNRSISEI